MSFAERLRQLREQAGLPQEAVARKCDLSIGAVRNYEQGIREPSFTALLKLARGLSVSLAVFDDVALKADVDDGGNASADTQAKLVPAGIATKLKGQSKPKGATPKMKTTRKKGD